MCVFISKIFQKQLSFKSGCFVRITWDKLCIIKANAVLSRKQYKSFGVDSIENRNGKTCIFQKIFYFIFLTSIFNSFFKPLIIEAHRKAGMHFPWNNIFCICCWCIYRDMNENVDFFCLANIRLFMYFEYRHAFMGLQYKWKYIYIFCCCCCVVLN